MKLLLLGLSLVLLTSCASTPIETERDKIKACSMSCRKGLQEYSDDTISCKCYKSNSVEERLESNEKN